MSSHVGEDSGRHGVLVGVRDPAISLSLLDKLVTRFREGAKAACGKVQVDLNRGEAILRSIYNVISFFLPPPQREKDWERYKSSWTGFVRRLKRMMLKDTAEDWIKFHTQLIVARCCDGVTEPEDKGYPVFFSGFIRRLMWRKLRRESVGKDLGRGCLFRSLYEAKRLWEPLSPAKHDEAVNDHKVRTCPALQRVTNWHAKKWVKYAADLVVRPGTKFCAGSGIPTGSACRENTRADGGNRGLLQPSLSGLVLPLALDSCHREIAVSFHHACGATEDPHVDYRALDEPGKIRVITVGPGRLYTKVRPVQAFLLKQWKETPYSTMSETFVDKLKEYTVSSNPLEGSWLSGDYKAATDLLNGDVGRLALKRVLKNCSLYTHSLGQAAVQCFKPAWVHYPDGEIRRQVDGQLMGNPLSFPILCILNLSCALRSLAISEGYHDPSDLPRGWVKTVRPLFINGDDILFRASRLEYQLWLENAGEIGLSMSPGKNIYSSKFLMINSIMFYADGTPVPYLNQSLLYDHHIKGGVRETTNIAANWDKVVRWITDSESVEKLARWFCVGNRSQLGRVRVNRLRSYTPNWQVPVYLGGRGINFPFLPSFSLAQRRVAGYFHRHPVHSMILGSGERAKSEASDLAVKRTFRFMETLPWRDRGAGIPWVRDREDHDNSWESVFDNRLKVECIRALTSRCNLSCSGVRNLKYLNWALAKGRPLPGNLCQVPAHQVECEREYRHINLETNFDDLFTLEGSAAEISADMSEWF